MMKMIHNMSKSIQPSASRVKMLVATTLTLSISGLMGCQSTAMSNLGTKQQSLLTPQELELQSIQAKAQLQKALKHQMRSSFSFETDGRLSNAKRLHALENATPEQLAHTSKKEDYCKHIHDIAYVSLLKKSKADGNDIEDTAYDSQRDTLKTDYQACEKSYDTWYDSYHYGDNKEEYLPDYDINHTAKDLKSAKVRSKYLLSPLVMKYTGVYQPLKGKIAFMPSAKFESRNLLLSINQPMYFDIKANTLYIWAENFAYPTSMLIDEKLGSKWQNKWLKISLNDGTLPDGFGKQLIKAGIKSFDEAYEKTPADTFRYVSKNDIKTALPYLSERDFNTFANSNTIIARVQNQELNRRNTYFFTKVLYDEMYSKYPDLLSYDTKKDDKKYGKMSNATIMVGFFNSLTSIIDTYESEFMNEDGSLQALDSSDETIISYAHYGFNSSNSKDIMWSHLRFDIPSDLNIPEELKLPDSDIADENMMIDSLTTYGPVSKTPFLNLPTDVQIPNDSNSVDAKEYFADLVKHYEDGNGTLLGKIAFEAYHSYLDRAKVKISSDKPETESHDNDSESQENKEIAELLLSQDSTSELETTEITANGEGAEATRQAFNNPNKVVLDDAAKDSNKELGKVVKSSSDIEVFTRTDITPNKEASFEPAQCVLMSVSIEMMCEADFINMDDSIEVASCLDEQVQMQKVYKSICPDT